MILLACTIAELTPAKLPESLRQRCVVKEGDEATVRLAARVIMNLAVAPSDMCGRAVNLFKRVQTLEIQEDLRFGTIKIGNV